MISVSFAALFGAFLFRLRGGWPALGSTFAARMFYANGMAIIAAAAASDLRMLLLVAPFYFGSIFPWFGSIDLGRNEGSWLKDAALNGLRGFLFTIFPAIFFPLINFIVNGLAWAFGFESVSLDVHFGWWYAFVGFTCPFLYALGWRTRSAIRNFERGTPLGEVYFGAVLGLGLALAVAS